MFDRRMQQQQGKGLIYIQFTISHALKIKPSESVRRRYLHPLRDVDPTMRIFQSWFRDDCQILMIGPDTLLLKERIRNPEAYYQHYRGHNFPQLETWVVVRAAALVALEDILNLDTLRQCLCLYDHNKPDHSTLDIYTLAGESILVKYFDLFHCSGVLSSRPVGLRFLGMQFRLPWNINKAISPSDRWTPKDGMPYIDTAYPERDAALIFNCDYSLDVDERWTVSIQTNVFRDGLF
ncbi:hypothetical protein BJX63DRAFT_444545 [Aspergillus granulosus]|uniref:Uncharacterized protein n=1 Tax=Aspergillus granulosus TaxID=176169 RepID=A0ABR4H553_9EURO